MTCTVQCQIQPSRTVTSEGGFSQVIEQTEGEIPGRACELAPSIFVVIEDCCHQAFDVDKGSVYTS